MTNRWLAWGRVARLSLFPSAAADAAVGTVLATGHWPGGLAPWALIAASLAVYHGGMALNDWADREHDAATRPDRPIPAGVLSGTSVLTAAIALLILGPLLARVAGPGAALLLAGVAALAAFYDLGPRGPVLGPLLLALCRAGNLGAGVMLGLAASPVLDGADLGGAAWSPGHFCVLALYGTYVFAISRLGRLEDLPEGTPLGSRPSRLLQVAAASLVAAPLLVGLLGWGTSAVAAGLAVGVAIWAALPLLRAARTPGEWSPARVLPAMGLALRRLLVFTAVCALARGGAAGVGVFLAALVGYPASWGLRRAFPPS